MTPGPAHSGRETALSRYGGRIVLLLAGAIGIVLSIGLARHLQAQETRNIAARFTAEVDEGIDELQRSLDMHLESLGALGAVFDTFDPVDHAQFETFARLTMRRYPAIHTLEWIPRVPREDRARFEADAHRSGLAGFRIRAMAEVPAPQRDAPPAEHFPVYFVEPVAGREGRLGLDLASEPVRRITLDAARDRGRMEATGRLGPLDGEAKDGGIVVFRPVYRDGDPRTIDGRRQRLRGFVSGTLHVAAVVDRATNRMAAGDDLAIRLVDLSAIPELQTLYSRDPDGAAAAAGPVYERELLEIAGRRWVVTATPREGYVADRRSIQPLVALLLGLVGTAVAVASLRVAIGRSRAVRNLVRERTGDLSDATRRLERQNSILQSVLDNLGDGVAVADENGKLLLFNPTAEKILGLGVTDSGPERWSEVYGLFRPDTEEPIPTDELPLSRAIAGETCRDVEMLVRNPSRRGEVYIRVTATPLRGPSGELKGGVAVFRDITDRKWAERVLRDSEARFRTIVEATSSVLIILSPRRRIQEFNPQAEQVFGVSRAEALSQDFLDLCVPRERRADLTVWLDRAAAGVPTEEVETVIRSHDGDERILLWSVRRMSETEPAIVATALDITQRHHAEEARSVRELAAHLESAREAERAHLAREIHDELGQSLTGLKFAVSSLRRRVGGGGADVERRLEEVAGLIDGTIRSVRGLAAALRPQLLDEFGLVEAIRWHVVEFEQLTGLSCSLDLPEEDIDWSPERSTAMFRMLQESLTNVARHAEARHVSVRIARDDGQVTLEVRDDGRGITPEQLTNSQSFGLRGMQERARMFGGRFEIRGETGRGTTVTASMPA